MDNLLDEYDLENFDIRTVFLDFYENSKLHNEIFKVLPNGDICFLHKYNLIKFIYPNRCEINSLLNINIKNQKTYEIIKVVEFLQKKFLISNDLKDIKQITHDDIVSTHKIFFNSFLSKPMISLTLNNTYYRNKENKVQKLSFLAPKKHFIDYIKIKRILAIYPFASDTTIKEKLKLLLNTELSSMQIFKIRKKYFIPNKSTRSANNNYVRFDRYFSEVESLDAKGLSKYKNIEAVYELVNNIELNYNYRSFNTVYIGSTKNLYKRLNEYQNKQGHTSKMKEHLKSNKLSFRFIKTKEYKHLETVLLNEFIDYCGELPFLNTNKANQ